jgi:hypothetical protein
VVRHHDRFAVAICEAGNRCERRFVFERSDESDGRLFGFLSNDRIDFWKVRQNFFCRERSEVSADGDVPAVPAFTQRDTQREKISSAPLKRERHADKNGLHAAIGLVPRLQNRGERRSEITFEIERNELRTNTRRRKRRRDVPQAEVFFDLRPHERDVAHGKSIRATSAGVFL